MDNPQVFIRVEVGALERSFQKVNEPFLNNCRFQDHQFTHSKTVYLFVYLPLFCLSGVVCRYKCSSRRHCMSDSFIPDFFPTPILLLLFLHFPLLSLANVAFTCVVYIYHSNVTANSGSVVVSSGTWCGLLLH